jgi:hypothetical protein
MVDFPTPDSPVSHSVKLTAPPVAGYFFAARLAAQYFFIRSDTAFLAAADIVERFRTGVGAEARSLLGLKRAAVPTPSWPRRCGKCLMSVAISDFSSSYLCSAPLRAISKTCNGCLAIGDKS